MSQKLEDVLDLNDVFTHAYIEAMFFTESGDIGLPLNDVVYSDISLEFAKQTAEDIAEFKERAGILIEEHPSQAGQFIPHRRRRRGRATRTSVRWPKSAIGERWPR